MSPARAQPPMGSVDGPVSRVAGPAGSDPTRCSSPHSLPRALKPSQTYWRSKLPPSVLNPQALPSSLRAGPATPSPTVRTGGSCGVLSTEPDRRSRLRTDGRSSSHCPVRRLVHRHWCPHSPGDLRVLGAVLSAGLTHTPSRPLTQVRCHPRFADEEAEAPRGPGPGSSSQCATRAGFAPSWSGGQAPGASATKALRLKHRAF